MVVLGGWVFLMSEVPLYRKADFREARKSVVDFRLQHPSLYGV